MKSPLVTDPFLQDVLQKVNEFFADADAARIQKLLGDTNYEFYRTVKESYDDERSFSVSLSTGSTALDSFPAAIAHIAEVDFRCAPTANDFLLAA